MIELLDHHSESVANEIYEVFQLSYEVEAVLVGSEDFPPLRRSASHIRSSSSQFLGERVEADLASVIEFSHSGDILSIDSLVVHPEYFRRGLASQLLKSLLARVCWRTADVETAVANAPAIDLYEKSGFSKSKQWKAAEGIEKVQLIYRKTGLDDC